MISDKEFREFEEKVKKVLGDPEFLDKLENALTEEDWEDRNAWGHQGDNNLNTDNE